MHRAATNVTASPSTAVKRWTDFELRPGVGTAGLQIGDSIANVEALLGSPPEKLPSGDQYFYIYRTLGIDIDFGESQRRVTRVFFYGANVEGHVNAPVVEARGITFNCTRRKVIEVFGAPDFEGGPVRVANRKKRWLGYNEGIQFEFDSRNRVILIILFDPRLATGR